jgi:hypothetical protein
MTKAYNVSYSGGRDPEHHGPRPVQAKSPWDSISTNAWLLWYVPVIPVTWGNSNRRIYSSSQQNINWDPISKPTSTKRSDRVAQVMETLVARAKHWVPNSK